MGLKQMIFEQDALEAKKAQEDMEFYASMQKSMKEAAKENKMQDKNFGAIYYAHCRVRSTELAKEKLRTIQDARAKGYLKGQTELGKGGFPIY